MRLRLVDGSPSLRKHHGSVIGISDTADFVVRTAYANTGQLTAKGAPPAPPSSGDVGNVLLQLHSRAQRLTQLLDMDAPEAPTEVLREVVSMVSYQLKFLASSANWSVADASGNTLSAQHGGAATTLQVGDGAAHVCKAEDLQALYTSLVAAFNSHTHTVLVNPTTPVVSASPNSAAPAWAPSVASSQVTIPRG